MSDLMPEDCQTWQKLQFEPECFEVTGQKWCHNLRDAVSI